MINKNEDKSIIENEDLENKNHNINEIDDEVSVEKQVRNSRYIRAILGFLMGIAFYQILTFLVKMLE